MNELQKRNKNKKKLVISRLIRNLFPEKVSATIFTRLNKRKHNDVPAIPLYISPCFCIWSLVLINVSGYRVQRTENELSMLNGKNFVLSIMSHSIVDMCTLEVVPLCSDIAHDGRTLIVLSVIWTRQAAMGFVFCYNYSNLNGRGRIRR